MRFFYEELSGSFEWEEVSYDEMDPKYRKAAIKILKMKKVERMNDVNEIEDENYSNETEGSSDTYELN